MRRRTLLGLAVTLAACAGLAFFIWRTVAGGVEFEWGGAHYELLQPRWLLAFAVTPLFAFAATRSLADLPAIQRWIGVLLRAALAGLLALAVARLARTTDATRVSTIFLVDVSDSMTDEALQDAAATVREAYDAREDADVQLVTFAREAHAVPITADDELGVARHEGDDAGRGTNIQAAIQLAYGLFPPGHLRRVVLIGDGGQTDGDLLAEASRAHRFGVQIHYWPDRRGAPPEVALRELVLPDRIEVGEPFPVRARLFASVPSSVRLRLYQGETLNGLDSVRDIDLEPGETEVEFRSIVRVAGPVTYRMTATPSARGAAAGTERVADAPAPASLDRFAANNQFETTVVVPGKPTVLYVEGAEGRASYLASALTAADYEVDVRNPRAIPTSVRELERYDFFILSDVSADQVSLGQMDAIERYVRDLGGGFIMAGGERAFGLGGWQGTRMERLLPVRMDAERRRDQPSLALALVIDRSGSMNGPKIELAKEAAKATAELLSGDDYIEVVGFDSRPERIVRMQSARNRMRILRDIGRLSARGGTAIFPALDMAYQDLAVTRARVKHVILLTDGQAPESGITELTQVMRAEGITVSTVGLGADVNRALLQSIANLGGGRSYLTSDPHNVPRIFMRETSTVSRSSAVEEYFQPSVVHRADFLRGVPIEGAPFLHGYVATRAKPTPAQVILQSDLGEPILARWRVGLGWSMAWTSDVKNRWAVEWVRWRGFSQFWAQLVREHMRERRQQRLDMVAEMQGDEVRVVVDAVGGDDHFLNGLDSTLRVEGPMGSRRARDDETDAQLRRTREIPLRQTAPGRYEARFPLDAFGSFVLTADHRREDRSVAESATQLANPYPAEYRTLEPDEALLASAAELTGGEAEPTPARLFDAGGETIRAHEELWPWLLYFALGLFVLDLLFRRVRLFDRGFKRPARR